MIIDAHVHPVFDEVPEAIKRRQMANAKAGILHRAEATVNALISDMNTFKVDRSVIVAVQTKFGYNTSNATIGKLVKQYPDKFIGFGIINPLEGEKAALEYEKAVMSYGFKGIKLMPNYQHFYPSDERCFPLYEKAVELNIPVSFHTGPGMPESRLKFGLPIYLDDVAVNFPDLKIIAIHLGGGFFNEMYLVARKNKNIYLDLAATTLTYGDLLPELILKILSLENGSNRLLFATDWPVTGQGKLIQVIENLNVSQGVKRKILGENAAALIGV